MGEAQNACRRKHEEPNMRPVVKFAVVLAGIAVGGPSLAAGGFDGAWNVELSCPAYGEAEGFVWRFPARVSGGHLSGKWVSSSDAMNYQVLTGNIGAGGDALLTMNGRTGASNYTIHHDAPHTTSHFTASVHFDATSGSGRRNEHRPCDLRFSRV